jgi:hypothetical protein
MVTYTKKCASRPFYAKAFGENIQKYLVKALEDMGKPRTDWNLF